MDVSSADGGSGTLLVIPNRRRAWFSLLKNCFRRSTRIHAIPQFWFGKQMNRFCLLRGALRCNGGRLLLSHKERGCREAQCPQRCPWIAASMGQSPNVVWKVRPPNGLSANAPGEKRRSVLSNAVSAPDPAYLRTLTSGVADPAQSESIHCLGACFAPKLSSTGSGFGSTVSGLHGRQRQTAVEARSFS